VNYTSLTTQTVDTQLNAFYPFPVDTEVDDNNAYYVKAHIYNSAGDVFTGISVNMTYGIDSWELGEYNVSSLPEGTYYFLFEVSAHYYPLISVKGGSFTVVHMLHFLTFDLEYDVVSHVLNLDNISIISSYSVDDVLSPSELDNSTYEIYTYLGDYTETSTSVSDDLFYEGNGTFVVKDLLLDLDVGEYYVRLRARTPYSGVHQINSTIFAVTTTILVSKPLTRYYGGLRQNVRFSNLKVTHPSLSLAMNESHVSKAAYTLLAEDNTSMGISGNFTHIGNGLWEAIFNTTNMDDGTYYAYIDIDTYFYGKGNASSDTFTVKHAVIVTEPERLYHRDTQTLDVFNVSAYSSFPEAPVLTDTKVDVHEYRVYRNIDDTATTVSGDLVYNSTWKAMAINVSVLPEGDYYVMALFGYRNKTAEERSLLTFRVEHDVYVLRPSAYYDARNDTIVVSNITAYSTDPAIGELTNLTATRSSVRVMDPTGENAILHGALDYDGTSWGYVFLNASENGIVNGTYIVEVTFATMFTPAVSNTSDPFVVSHYVPYVPVDDDVVDDDVVDDDDTIFDWATGGAGMVCFVIGIILFVIIVLALVVILIVVNKKKQQKEAQGGEETLEGEKEDDDGIAWEGEDDDDDDWGDDDEDWGDDDEDDEDWDDEDDEDDEDDDDLDFDEDDEDDYDEDDEDDDDEDDDEEDDDDEDWDFDDDDESDDDESDDDDW